MSSKKCPTKEQLYNDVVSPMTWQEVAVKYGYTSPRFLMSKARKWGLPKKTRKYVGFNYTDPIERRIYLIWHDMKKRCYQPQNKRYARYGGRGIRICDEWLNNFQAFFDWSMANGYSPELSIDRIEKDINYEPSNCRWATIIEQANNRSNNHFITYKGKTKTMKEWSATVGISYYVLRSRLNRGWDIEKALFTPIGGAR